MRRSFARGEGKAGCIFWTLILAFVVYAGYSIIPVQMKKAQLKDYIDELTLHNGMQKPDWIKGQIRGRAEDMRLPVEMENIKINQRRKSVMVEVKFTTVHDFVVTDYVWDHEILVDREVFNF